MSDQGARVPELFSDSRRVLVHVIASLSSEILMKGIIPFI